jgi:hypothetical protein
MEPDAPAVEAVACADEGPRQEAPAEPAGEATAAPAAPDQPNSKKRKVALFMAYSGNGYQGMQRNPGAKTIEQDLFQAICAAGGIAEHNADDQGFQKARLSPAAGARQPPRPAPAVRLRQRALAAAPLFPSPRPHAPPPPPRPCICAGALVPRGAHRQGRQRRGAGRVPQHGPLRPRPGR